MTYPLARSVASGIWRPLPKDIFKSRWKHFFKRSWRRAAASLTILGCRNILVITNSKYTIIITVLNCTLYSSYFCYYIDIYI